MTMNDGLGERTAGDAVDAPAGHLPAPLRRGRTSRRRRLATAAVAAAVGLGLVGGFLLQRRGNDQAPEDQAAAARPQQEGQGLPAATTAELPWASAMVARNGTSITVFTGTDPADCKELLQPQATVTDQDDAKVVISVSARVVEAADCSATSTAAPVVVSLQEPLGDRVLRDAAADLPRPTYFQRDLPDLRSDTRWDPFTSHWMPGDESWHQGFNGPEGVVLLLSAQPTTGARRTDTVATIPIGSRRGTITGTPHGTWTLWWEAGDATYSMRLTPAEGRSLPLRQFKQEIVNLTWP
ncbi:MAG: hypothetical protein WA890_24810 [Micromonospora sp.]